MGLDDGVAARDDDLVAAHHGAELDARGQIDLAQGVAHQGRGFQRLGLNHLGDPVGQAVNAEDAALADVLEDGGEGGGAGADDHVDAQRGDQRREGRVVDQGHRALASLALGQQRGKDIDLVVVGHGDDGLGRAHVGLVE